MSSPPPPPPRPENAAAHRSPFHVLNSGSGTAGQASAVAPAYLQPPQAAASRSPPGSAIAVYGAAAAVTAMAGSSSNAEATALPAPHLLQQLMILAGWTTRPPPCIHNYAPSFSSGLRRVPLPSMASRPPGPSSSGVGDNGTAAVAVRSSAGGNRSSGGRSAGRGKGKLLQIQSATATAAGAVQRLGPVLAMPTTAGVARGKVTPSTIGRGRKRAPKGTDHSAGDKKPRRKASGNKVAAAADAKLVAGNPSGSRPAPEAEIRGLKIASPAAPPSNSLKIVSPAAPGSNGGKKSVSPAAAPASNGGKSASPAAAGGGGGKKSVSPAKPGSNGRKRKNNATPASTKCNLLARMSSAATLLPAMAKKHTVLTWLIDAGFLNQKEKVFYVPSGGPAEKVISGLVTTAGVLCSCCHAAVPLPEFESHAGCDRHRHRPGHGPPWEKLLLMSGKPVLRCMQEAWGQERVKMLQVQEKTRALLEQDKAKRSLAKKKLVKPLLAAAAAAVSPQIRALKDCSDDACGICGDGGQLLCCDTCTSTFHPDCLPIRVPESCSWICHYCRCLLCMANDDHGLPTCQQCARRYHQHCRPSLNPGRGIGPYCSETCKKLAARLSDMVGVMNRSEDGFSWALLKIQKDEPVSSEDMPAVLECNVKLAVALGVLNECFKPVKDPRTMTDMLHQAVYSLGSEFKRFSCEGFYTMILEKDGEIISVSLLRFHGTKLAEMPFAGTMPAYQKQGMMRRLVKAVEQVLWSLQVENLVIPSVAGLVDTWRKSFYFRPMEPQLREEMKKLSLIVITNTTLLQKPIAAQAQQGSSDQLCRHTFAPIRKDMVARLSDDELAFLEMAPFCSFTDLVAGDHVPLQFFAGDGRVSMARTGSSSSASAPPGLTAYASYAASCSGFRPSYAQSKLLK